MSVDLLELLTAEDGRPHLAHSQVELRSSGRDLMGDQASMSAAFDCRHMVFVDFPVGFKKSFRVPDREQFAVVLKGTLKITAGDGDDAIVEAGGVLHLPKAERSEHSFEVLSAESVTLMVVLE